MLNKDGQRELCYVVRIDSIEPIPGRDRVECARVGGWTCMIPVGAFKSGDLGIYFEIDSKLDTSKPEFAFTEKYHGKIKTQKFALKDAEGNKIGNFYSQGLLMSVQDFGWTLHADPNGITVVAKTETGGVEELEEGDFLTTKLGVTYADPEDNKRKSNKSNPNAKYQRMMNRHPKLAKSRFGRWCMKHTFTKKLLYLILGGDKKNGVKSFPSHIVKTDEERVQNCFSYVHSIDTKWIVTEKRDGTSTTMSLKGHGKKQEYFVCSRNVVMTNRKDGSWYDINVYTEMADKYSIKNVLEDLLTDEYEFVTIQGETFGEGIQKRDYGLKEHVFEAFNVIFGYKDGTTKRLNPIEMKELMDKYNVPTVPIVATNIVLPDTCEEVLAMAAGEAVIYGGMREGLVFRSLNGVHSFKAVDNEFLVKYHG